MTQELQKILTVISNQGIHRLKDLLNISITILGSIGIGSAIVLGFSSWLGKVWASRIMQEEAQKHRIELEKLKSTSEQASLNYKHKIELYKAASEPLINLLIKIYNSQNLTPDDMIEFEKGRLNTIAHLGLFASSKVFNDFNDLIDFIHQEIQKPGPLDFKAFRVHALRTLSSMRKDIGVHHDELSYTGKF